MPRILTKLVVTDLVVLFLFSYLLILVLNHTTSSEKSINRLLIKISCNQLLKAVVN